MVHIRRLGSHPDGSPAPGGAPEVGAEAVMILTMAAEAVAVLRCKTLAQGLSALRAPGRRP
eukprot:2268583-Lingulodinium_polyedra.AAC.1